MLHERRVSAARCRRPCHRACAPGWWDSGRRLRPENIGGETHAIAHGHGNVAGWRTISTRRTAQTMPAHNESTTGDRRTMCPNTVRRFERPGDARRCARTREVRFHPRHSFIDVSRNMLRHSESSSATPGSMRRQPPPGSASFPRRRSAGRALPTPISRMAMPGGFAGRGIAQVDAGVHRQRGAPEVALGEIRQAHDARAAQQRGHGARQVG